MLRREIVLTAASVAILLLASLSIIFVMNPRTSSEEKYTALSDQEKQWIVDEVWSRLEAKNYTGQIVGWDTWMRALKSFSRVRQTPT